MRHTLALLALIAAGCADTDPATSQLQPGQRVVIVPTEESAGGAGIIRGENGYPIDSRLPASKLPWLSRGDEAVVIADPGKDPDNDRTLARRYRHVTIEVTLHRRANDEYDYTSLKCQARRIDLRAIPQP